MRSEKLGGVAPIGLLLLLWPQRFRRGEFGNWIELKGVAGWAIPPRSGGL